MLCRATAAGAKRRADPAPVDESTRERAEAVIQEVRDDYAKTITELGHAYRAASEKTKDECWRQLTNRLGSGLLDALGVGFDTFFVTSAPAAGSGFSLLPRQAKRAKIAAAHRDYASLSGDEADSEREEHDSNAVLEKLMGNAAGVVVRWVPGTQFTTRGGDSACTAIAFAAAYRMSLVRKVEILEWEVDWEQVLVIGSEIWNIWKNKASGGDNRRFISVEDIRNMSFTDNIFGKVWDTLGSTDTEKMGYIDDMVNADLGGEKGGAINLRDALQSMADGSSTTAAAVVCAGAYGRSNSSLALWRGGAGHFAMYDSHGSRKPGHSTLRLMRDLDSAVRHIRTLLSAMPATRLEKHIGGMEKCVMYSMHILRFEFTAVV